MMTAFLEMMRTIVQMTQCKDTTYHVITLSATGEAETPAGGSVCIRCEQIMLAEANLRQKNLGCHNKVNETKGGGDHD